MLAAGKKLSQMQGSKKFIKPVIPATSRECRKVRQ